jgi:D-3-phosphoglycerate dehydrogenase / 2-oxoglutarate reductase
MKIVIPDDYQNCVKDLKCFALLHGHDVTIYNTTAATIDEQVERFGDADILVLTRERTAITAELLARLPKLKLISQTGKISNHLDLAACTNYNVEVAEGVGSPIAPAELTWALIMNGWRELPQAIADMKEGKWQTNIGRLLKGKQLGIWGYGKIGKRIAGYAKAFEMQVVVWGSESSRKNAVEDGFAAAESKEAFFAQSDIVSLHLRLTASTKSCVKAEDLAKMKPDALFVNTSRAELVEEGALVAALNNGHPGMAAVDVYEQEPVYDVNHPLLNMRNVICSPHLGYVERSGYELYFSKAFENIVAFASGNPTNIINPKAIV